MPGQGPRQRQAAARPALSRPRARRAGARHARGRARRARRRAPLGRVLVVTTDAEVAAVASARAPCCVPRAPTAATPRRSPAGSAAAGSAARRSSPFPGDVPCVTAAGDRRACWRPRAGPRRRLRPLALVASARTPPCLAPPDAMPLRFGEPSFDNHLAAARAAGLDAGACSTCPASGSTSTRPRTCPSCSSAGRPRGARRRAARPRGAHAARGSPQPAARYEVIGIGGLPEIRRRRRPGAPHRWTRRAARTRRSRRGTSWW